MKPILNNTLGLLVAILTFAGVSQAKDDEKPCWSLGDQLYRALKSGDVVDYSACWMSSRDMVSFHHQFSDEITIAIVECFTKNRNKDVLNSFQFLSKELAKHGKLSELQLIDVKVEGEKVEAEVRKKIDLVRVFVRSGHATFEIVIGDAYEFHGSWIFYAPPRFVIMPDDEKRTLMFMPST